MNSKTGLLVRLQLAIVLVATAALPQAALAEKRKLMVGAFEDVTVYGDFQVEIVTGKSPFAYATGDRRILDLLRLDRNSEHLIIRIQQPPNDDNRRRITEPLIIYLGTPTIRNISISGNSRLHINGIKRDGINRIILDGGGSVDIDTIKTDQLEMSITGAGRITVGNGTVRESRLRVQGAGVYDGQKLLSRKFDLQQNGNATVNAMVEESAVISNLGAGNISITGNAECFIRKAGSAVISCPQDDDAPKAIQNNIGTKLK
jgi:hypothetical protein